MPAASNINRMPCGEIARCYRVTVSAETAGAGFKSRHRSSMVEGHQVMCRKSHVIPANVCACGSKDTRGPARPTRAQAIAGFNAKFPKKVP